MAVHEVRDMVAIARGLVNDFGGLVVHWISHRGIRDGCGENTIEAFVAARAAGFARIETDLRCTRDGQVVTFHDPDLRRVANRPEKIAHLLAEEVRSVPLAAGGRPAFFDELYAEFRDIQFTFDVKRETGWQVIDFLRAWCHSAERIAWIEKHCKFLFWDAKQQQSFLAHWPSAHCYARQSECIRTALYLMLGLHKMLRIKPLVTYSLTPSFVGITLFRSSFVRAIQQNGGFALAFLPSHASEIQNALLAGFDEILIDGPKPAYFQ